MERKETRELDAKIRRRWADWQARVGDRQPLSDRCAAWEERAAALLDRQHRELIRGIQPPRERQAPPDIVADMNDVTPQAVLRDLHRPVLRFGINAMDRIETGWDRGARAGVGEIKQLLHAHYRVPVESLLHTQADIREDFATLREILALKWEDAPKLGFGATATSGDVEEIPSIGDEMLAARGLK